MSWRHIQKALFPLDDIREFKYLERLNFWRTSHTSTLSCCRFHNSFHKEIKDKCLLIFIYSLALGCAKLAGAENCDGSVPSQSCGYKCFSGVTNMETCQGATMQADVADWEGCCVGIVQIGHHLVDVRRLQGAHWLPPRAFKLASSMERARILRLQRETREGDEGTALAGLAAMPP